jgi:hypothetical protein
MRHHLPPCAFLQLDAARAALTSVRGLLEDELSLPPGACAVVSNGRLLWGSAPAGLNSADSAKYPGLWYAS